MIEYDYEIQRDEGNVIKKYIPNERIGKKLPNLVLIEAPNSSGKSTLLNILAVGFFGLKNSENIVESLVDDMKNLVLSDHQKIWFKLKIEEKNGVMLVSEKKIDDNPIVYKVGKSKKKTIAPETFNREYRLIYDIPDRPRDRLKDILKDIENLQMDIGEDIADFKKYIENILEDINKSKNPEQIKKLKERIERYNKLIEETEEKIKGYDNLLKDLEIYMAVKFFHQYYEQREKFSHMLKELKNKNKSIKRQYNKYRKSVEEFNSLVRHLMELKNDFLENIERLQYPDLMGKIEKINKNFKEQILLDIKSKDYNKKLLIIDQILTDIYNLVDSTRKKRENLLNKQIKELEITKKLIEILEEYKDLDITFPGTNKTIAHYLEELKKNYNEKKIIIDEYEIIKEILEKITEIKIILEKDIRFSAEKLKKMLPKDENIMVSKYTEDKKMGEKKISEKLDWLDDKLDEYSIMCNKYGIKSYTDIVMKKHDLESKDYIKEFAELDENEMLKKIDEFKQKIEDYKDEKRKYEVLRDEENEKLEKIKNLPEHKYCKYKEYIKTLENICSSVERKFKNTFYNYLQYLRSHDTNPNIVDDQDFLRYKEAISTYLGKKLGEIKYIDGIYSVEKVDLLKETIYTGEGKIIKLSDLGTGHMQAAYIQSVLNRDDPRKIIALFDEISHMDRKTLKPILRKVRELYKSGKLIACVMVQKNDEEVRVIDLEKEEL